MPFIQKQLFIVYKLNIYVYIYLLCVVQDIRLYINGDQ